MPAYKDEKRGTWYVSFYYQDWTGTRIKKQKRGFRTKKDALEWENCFKNERNVTMDITLAEFTEVYFKDKKNELKERTLKNKRYMIEMQIIPYLGNRSMSEIMPADVLRWQEIVAEKGYKPTYLRMLNNQLTALFTHAQKIYDLKNNPCRRVKKMGKADAEKLTFWTKDEYDKFISTVPKTDMYYTIFQILFWTGCREGELLALTKKDIDLEENSININKTYFRMDGRDLITVPKTEGSVRTIAIPEFLKLEINDYMSRLYECSDDQRLFPISARAVQKKFKYQIEKAGVQPIRVHDLRHSHVAFLINEGVSSVVIKERLGHKDIQITINTYGHLYPNQQKAVADLLDQRR